MLKLDSEKTKMVRKIVLPIVIGVLVVGAVAAIPLLFHGETNNGGDHLPSQSSEDSAKVEEPVNLEILCVGDIMVHEPQIASQLDPQTGKYDYNNNFQYVKKYIESADLALGNFEGTFGGPPYRGYPAFSTPDELASALKTAGFDVAITANNHMVDTGKAGVLRTLQVLSEAGLVTSGSRLDSSGPQYAISKVKGVRVATISYTYESSGAGEDVAINGNYISQETAQLINTFSYGNLDEDMGKINGVVASAREAGADLIVLYLHWGEEYQREPNDWQKQIVRAAIDEMKVDIIFASHPHVLQKMEMITSETTGKSVPVFYSMGNFISNQRDETLQNRYTEQGMISRVNLEYMVSTGKTVSVKMDAIPTWVDRYKRNGKTVYEIIPLDEEMENNPALAESGHLLRAKEALEDINGILEIN